MKIDLSLREAKALELHLAAWLLTSAIEPMEGIEVELALVKRAHKALRRALNNVRETDSNDPGGASTRTD